MWVKLRASRGPVLLQALKDCLSCLVSLNVWYVPWHARAAPIPRHKDHLFVQVQAHEVRKCTDMLAQVAEDIQTRQRDMSRDVIEPTVQDTMTDGYAACCAEAGPGQFERMRRLMKSTVERHKSSMFAERLQVLTV